MRGWGVHKILEDELAKYKIGTIHSCDAILKRGRLSGGGALAGFLCCQVSSCSYSFVVAAVPVRMLNN